MFRKKINFDLDEFRSRPLPSEQEVMSGWTGDLDKPVVSVICNTYNQEMYIEDAIRGFLIQETDFPFEVIINDDASTDRNPEIIKSYAEKYPSIIKPVFQEENQYSQGRKPSVISFPYTSGKYIALCEGDDFWIAPEKLQAQFDVMERKAVGLVFSSAIVVKGDNPVSVMGQCSTNDVHISFERVVFGGGSFCPTASIFVERKILKTLFGEPWFLQAPVGDLYIQAYCSSINGAYFLAEPTCVYRRFSTGSWSARTITAEESENTLARQLIAIEGLRDSLSGFDQSLYEYMRANAFYHSAIRSLMGGQNKSFKDYLEKSRLQGAVKETLGQRFFFIFRRLPVIARFAADIYIYR